PSAWAQTKKCDRNNEIELIRSLVTRYGDGTQADTPPHPGNGALIHHRTLCRCSGLADHLHYRITPATATYNAAPVHHCIKPAL
ncbi:hypothetical protein, partial [Xylella fastidiosa]|uniref:hypothetical protein n=1 Tax=Xylella fastidiosa TaxID=2371 RepID=UPI001A7E92C2